MPGVELVWNIEEEEALGPRRHGESRRQHQEVASIGDQESPIVEHDPPEVQPKHQRHHASSHIRVEREAGRRARQAEVEWLLRTCRSGREV